MIKYALMFGAGIGYTSYFFVKDVNYAIVIGSGATVVFMVAAEVF
jgi:hypothetical protein